MKARLFYFGIFILIFLSQIFWITQANAVGVACEKTGDGVTINVNIAFTPKTEGYINGVTLSDVSNIVNSRWKSQLSRTWSNYRTSDCNMPVSFRFNTVVTDDCSSYNGYNCVHVTDNNAYLTDKCGRPPACNQLANAGYPTTEGFWRINVDDKQMGTAVFKLYCENRGQEISCLNPEGNVAAHEIGHAMGAYDEYVEASDYDENNIMGWDYACDNGAATVKPTQKQIDKIVQIWCSGLSDVCIYSTPQDQCDPSGDEICIANNKCYDETKSGCKCADGSDPNPANPDDNSGIAGTGSGSASSGEDLNNIKLQVPIFDYAVATSLPEYILNIFKYAMIVLVPLAIVMVMWGGIQWVGAAGNSQKITTAKKQISSAALGLILGLLTYTLLSFVGITQLNMPGLEKIEMEPDAEPLDLADEFGAGTDTSGSFSGEFGANPYKAICDQYPGRGYRGYREDIGLKCKALGNDAPPGMKIVPMGKYGAGGGIFASEAGLAAFIKAADCVKAKSGHTITGSGWRPALTQYNTFKSKKPGWAAKPCCSNHGTGAAFDVKIDGGKVGSWERSDLILKACFASAGLYAKIKGSKISEPWHFSPSGY